MNYLNATNYMFLGGLIMAIAVEHCGLHNRVALRIIMMVGTSQARLMLGFMFTTMFLSMWISNTATTAMMLPIVDAVAEAINVKHAEQQLAPLAQVEGVKESKSQVSRRTEHLSPPGPGVLPHVGGGGRLRLGGPAGDEPADGHLGLPALHPPGQRPRVHGQPGLQKPTTLKLSP